MISSSISIWNHHQSPPDLTITSALIVGWFVLIWIALTARLKTSFCSFRCLQQHMYNPYWWRSVVYRIRMDFSQPPIFRRHIPVGPIRYTIMWFWKHRLVRTWRKWHRGSIWVQRDWRATWGCQGLCRDLPMFGVMRLWLSTFQCAVSHLDGHNAGIVSFWTGHTISRIPPPWISELLIYKFIDNLNKTQFDVVRHKSCVIVS